MHPVVTGARLEAAATVTASLRLASGVTLPAIGGVAGNLGHFKARLGAEQQPFADTDGAGTWTAVFRFVVPGQYDVAIVAPTGLSISTTPAGVMSLDLASGQSATADFVLQTAVVVP
jgi:hypothetical protein